MIKHIWIMPSPLHALIVYVDFVLNVLSELLRDMSSKPYCPQGLLF